MRNRAKCKLCQEIIESLHSHDYQVCKCGEIAVDGGKSYYKCVARDFNNFLRVDDEGNEIVPTIVEEGQQGLSEAVKEVEATVLSLHDKIDQLKGMMDGIEKLPQHAHTLPITHYDHYALIAVLVSIFQEIE